jgi:hypothetical protein
MDLASTIRVSGYKAFTEINQGIFKNPECKAKGKMGADKTPNR